MNTPLLRCAALALCGMTMSPALPADPPPVKGVVGTWLGTLDAGAVKLRIAFHIRKTADGALSSTLDSLDQGAEGIPAAETTFSAGSLRLKVAAVAGGYEGTLAADGATLTGTWTQGG